jgi:ribonuclease P protein component
MLVLHAAATDPSGDDAGTRVGFVVPRAVGPAVTRNRVRRRLRHLLRDRLDALPPGSRLVVRVLPLAATATSAQLTAALDRALSRAVRSLQPPGAGASS